MLNREQQEVLSLLKEIDTICRKHGIEYYLSPELTLCAVTDRPFPQNPLAGAVLMKTAQMEQFARAFEEEAPGRRALESMKNNKRFPGFYLRYENMDTLCYRLNEGRNFKYPGIGIDIVPLRGKISSRLRHLWNRGLELGWRQMCDCYSDRPGVKKFLCKCLARACCLGGRARLGRSLYKKFCRIFQSEDTAKYVLRWKGGKTYYYPSEIFDGTEQVQLEDMTFTVPAGKLKYLEKTYGSDYEQRKPEVYKFNPSVMVSARAGYEEFFAEAGSQRKFIKERRRQYIRDAAGRRRQRYFNWCWDYAKLCAAGRRMDIYYAERKDYIRNLYKCGDYLRLEDIFRPYTRIIQRCLAEGDLYAADEELQEIYLAVLEKTGRRKLKERVEKFWR